MRHFPSPSAAVSDSPESVCSSCAKRTSGKYSLPCGRKMSRKKLWRKEFSYCREQYCTKNSRPKADLCLNAGSLRLSSYRRRELLLRTSSYLPDQCLFNSLFVHSFYKQNTFLLPSYLLALAFPFAFPFVLSSLPLLFH